MTQSNPEKSYTLWQESLSGVPEAAIIVEVYTDKISLQSDSGFVNVNYESIPELIKLLKDIQKEQKK